MRCFSAMGRRKYTQLLAFWLWLAAAAAAVADERPVVLVLGDSLSAAFGIDLEQGWVSLLEKRLAASHPHRVVNASVSGETTGGGLARLPALLKAHEPALVIVELGGNDGLRGQPLGLMRQHLTGIISASQAQGAEVLLLGMRIPPNYGPRYTATFANTFRELAEEHELAWVPFFLEGVATRTDLMQSDGIHPRASAQPQMLDNVWPALEPLLRATATP